MNPVDPNPLPGAPASIPSRPPWRRIVWLEFVLCLLPPLGLWLLWRDKTLTRSAKWRMVIYTFLIPTLVYIAIGLYLFDATERAIRAAGGGF